MPWPQSRELITAAGFDSEQMRGVIDYRLAAGELLKHVFLEMWLELDEDDEKLFGYCAGLFSDRDRVERALAEAYVARVVALPPSLGSTILLNNPRLIPLLEALPGAVPLRGTVSRQIR